MSGTELLGTSHRTLPGNSSDAHLEMVLCILRGIPEVRRESWMRQNMPHTFSMLAVSRLFDPGTRHSGSTSHNRSMRTVIHGFDVAPKIIGSGYIG